MVQKDYSFLMEKGSCVCVLLCGEYKTSSGHRILEGSVAVKPPVYFAQSLKGSDHIKYSQHGRKTCWKWDKDNETQVWRSFPVLHCLWPAGFIV